MAGITTARRLAVLSPRACSAQVCYLLLRVKPGCDHISCEENVTFFTKRPLFYAARVSASITGFGPHCPGIGPTPVSSVWHSARFVLWPRLGHAGRFSAPELATCTNSCSKKVFGKRLDYRCRLPATTWLMWTKLHPPPSSRSMFRSKSAHAPLQQERRYSGGVETSVCRRTWDINCHQDPAPEGSSMGEADGVHKRRMFRWPKEARELVREYKGRTSRSQEHNETGRRMLVTKLVAISGNPRDACLRFLRELGVNQKRAYREWTKPEQQHLLDLIIAMPVEEAAKILRRPAGSVRSMLHRLGIGGKTGREWFTKFSLSRALHTRPDEIQKWIDLGWLKSRTLATAGTKANIIHADDFCQFVKEHGRAVASRRLTYEALWFVQNYVFPPSHAELLSVRGTYKRHDAGETDPNTESQSASGSEEGGEQEG